LYSVEKLEILGYKTKPVPNTFFKQDSGANHLAVIFPGYSYRCNEPLLWYPTRVLLSLGADVLRVEYPYDSLPEFGTSGERVQKKWVFEDSTAALESVWKRRSYGRTTLVGKSLGTLAMGHVLTSTSKAEDIRGVWMTPVLIDPDLREAMEKTQCPSLVIIGSADRYYDHSFVELLNRKASTEVLVVQGADHILETKEGPIRSIDILKIVVESISRFVMQ
jgi:predicted alpha/beta-hydrolase family hydrolase